MSLFDLASLTEFTGTERYYRISRKHLLTDGTKFLADQAQCYWMMDAIASHLGEIGTAYSSRFSLRTLVSSLPKFL